MSSDKLKESIQKAVNDRFIELCDNGQKGIERDNSRLVAQMLYSYYGQGWSLNKTCKSVGMSRTTAIRAVRRYADYADQWRKLGGDLAADRVLNLHDIQTSMQNRYVDHLEENPDVIPSPKDIKEMSIALMNAERSASVARGEATSVTEERRITDKDYAETLDAVRKRIAEAKQAEVIDVDG